MIPFLKLRKWQLDGSLLPWTVGLVGENPLDPENWRKKKKTVFAGTADVISPGHASFTQSPDGTEDWIVYHTAKYPGAGWNREVRIQRFTWDKRGDPCFGSPVSSNVEMEPPSENFGK
ncbi:MAG: family 43 glycosylhydrolase [Victivallales bacterium]